MPAIAGAQQRPMVGRHPRLRPLESEARAPFCSLPEAWRRARGSGSTPPRRAPATPPARGWGTADRAHPRQSSRPELAREKRQGRNKPGPPAHEYEARPCPLGHGIGQCCAGGGLGGRSLEAMYIRPGARRPPHSRVRRLWSLFFAVFLPA